MGITKKNPPQNRDSNISRALAEVYRDINDIVESVNSSLISVRDTVGGKPGDIRVIKVSENKYRFEARAEEGWVRPGGVDTNVVKIIDALDGATLTGGTVTTSGTPTVDELETCVGVLAGKINEIITQLNNITFRLVKKGE